MVGWIVYVVRFGEENGKLYGLYVPRVLEVELIRRWGSLGINVWLTLSNFARKVEKLLKFLEMGVLRKSIKLLVKNRKMNHCPCQPCVFADILFSV